MSREAMWDRVRMAWSMLRSADLGDSWVEALGVASAFASAASDPEQEFFAKLIDDQVVDAITFCPLCNTAVVAEQRPAWVGLQDTCS